MNSSKDLYDLAHIVNFAHDGHRCRCKNKTKLENLGFEYHVDDSVDYIHEVYICPDCKETYHEYGELHTPYHGLKKLNKMFIRHDE